MCVHSLLGIYSWRCRVGKHAVPSPYRKPRPSHDHAISVSHLPEIWSKIPCFPNLCVLQKRTSSAPFRIQPESSRNRAESSKQSFYLTCLLSAGETRLNFQKLDVGRLCHDCSKLAGGTREVRLVAVILHRCHVGVSANGEAIAKYGMPGHHLLLNHNVITRVLLVRHFILVTIRFMLFHSRRNRSKNPFDLPQVRS